MPTRLPSKPWSSPSKKPNKSLKSRPLLVQLSFLTLVSVVSVCLVILLALRAITYEAFQYQQRSQLSWQPFAQARAIRSQDLAHLGRLMGSDATLVMAWRQSAPQIEAYAQAVAEEQTPAQLEKLRLECLPSLWDIAQRLFLESDPGTADSTPHTVAYSAYADLFLLCDSNGVVVLEETSQADPEKPDFGKVSVRFPLDPANDPAPWQRSLAQDALFQAAGRGPVKGTFWAYGPSHLYQAVAVPCPMGVIILGDRVDQQMAQEASQLTGQAETVILFDGKMLATSQSKTSEEQAKAAAGWTPQQDHMLEVNWGGNPYLAASYPLGQRGWMVFLKSTRELDALARQQAWLIAAIVGLSALLSFAISTPLARRIAAPLRGLSQAMARVGQGDLEATAPAQGPLEIVEAAQAFNQMVGGLRQKDTLEKFVTRLEQLRKEADPQDPLVRDQAQFGGYVVTRRLGVGGMATVYKALPAQTLEEAGRVAIKVIHRAFAQDEDYQRRFRREFEIMQRLEHPGLVRVLDSGDLNGLLYIAMEYVEGENLRDLLERKGQLEFATFVKLAGQMLEAVEAAHQAGVTHRDLKPENIMVGEQGVKVMDFGLAIASGTARITLSGDTVGTPRYLAPEQFTGGGGNHSDQYSLGVLFYEMLTGVTPFEGDNPMAVLLLHLNQPPARPRELRADLPEALENLILQMLAKDPRERFRNLLEIKAKLNLIQ